MSSKQIEKELSRISVEFENNVLNGNVADASNIRLCEFCEQYLDIAEQTLAPTTRAFYVSVIEKLIKPSIGHMKMKNIKPIHVQNFIQTLLGEGVRSDKRGENLSPSTFTVLKSIMAKAYKLGLTDINPTDTARLDLPAIEEPEVEIFTKEEAAHMLSCLDSEPLMFQVLIQLAIVTGCRRGELVALKWNNINFKTNTISVKQSNYKLKGEEVKTKTPKTKGSVREMAVSSFLIEMLRDYLAEQTKRRIELGDCWSNENWIFTQWDGKPMNPQTPTKQFSKFPARNDIPHRKFHALRHTSETLLLVSGTNMKTVASRLGHTQPSTTNRYLHALKDADEAAAQVFDDILSPMKPKEQGA